MVASPQRGYNHNIPHRGRLYHVQTEDSGAEKARIFTHVFFDGTIVASNKVEYGKEFDDDELAGHVVKLMQESHKSMIRQLRRGTWDEKIVQFLGPHPESEGSKAEALPSREAGDTRAEASPTSAEASEAKSADSRPTPLQTRTEPRATQGSAPTPAARPRGGPPPAPGQASKSPPHHRSDESARNRVGSGPTGSGPIGTPPGAGEGIIERRRRTAGHPPPAPATGPQASANKANDAGATPSRKPGQSSDSLGASRRRSTGRDITEDRPLQMVGLPLRHRRRGAPMDPGLAHPAYEFQASEARAGAPGNGLAGGAAAQQGQGAAAKGPRRLQRRALSGIGGAGVSPETKHEIRERRDVIVGRFASAHQSRLDEEILDLLREE